jgi:hypothetical protein
MDKKNIIIEILIIWLVLCIEWIILDGIRNRHIIAEWKTAYEEDTKFLLELIPSRTVYVLDNHWMVVVEGEK